MRTPKILAVAVLGATLGGCVVTAAPAPYAAAPVYYGPGYYRPAPVVTYGVYSRPRPVYAYPYPRYRYNCSPYQGGSGCYRR
jgi:hypothetical protein